MNQTKMSVAALLALGAASLGSGEIPVIRVKPRFKKDMWNHRPTNLPPREKVPPPPPKKHKLSRAERKRRNTRESR